MHGNVETAFTQDVLKIKGREEMMQKGGRLKARVGGGKRETRGTEDGKNATFKEREIQGGPFGAFEATPNGK